jgi:hypothetical protein
MTMNTSQVTMVPMTNDEGGDDNRRRRQAAMTTDEGGNDDRQTRHKWHYAILRTTNAVKGDEHT